MRQIIAIDGTETGQPSKITKPLQKCHNFHHIQPWAFSGNHAKLLQTTTIESPQLTDTTTPSTPPETLTFTYVPRPGLLKLTIVNFLLGLITFSIYRFWAKTNVRKHIWSSVHINNEPLEYTGTGKELFMGALMVFLIFILPLVLLSVFVAIYYGPNSPALSAIQFIGFFIAYVLWGYAVYKARKYQLSRTNWRGIRGTLQGSAATYCLLYFGSILAKSATLGWATPVMNTVLQEQIVNDMRFGDAAFKFKGRAGPLYGTYALCWILTFVAIIAGISMAVGMFDDDLFTRIDALFGEDSISSTSTWVLIGLAILSLIVLFSLVIPMLWAVYIAKELRTFANYTRFDGAQFQLDATTGSVIWLSLVNIIILLLTLGIGWPFINQRTMKFVIDRLSLHGAIDIDRIRQSQVALDKRGEGLADMFDVGGM